MALGEEIRAVARDQARAMRPENFADTPDIGGDQRLLRRQAFEHDIGQAFRATRRNDNTAERKASRAGSTP